MTAVLDLIRDLVLVSALAWVGVSVEPRQQEASGAPCRPTVVAASEPLCQRHTVMFATMTHCAADR